MKLLALTLPGAPGQPAQQINCPKGIPCGGLQQDLIPMIRNAVTLLIVLTIILVIIFIVWAGIQWTASGGDKAKLSAARARLTWAIIGLIIVLGSFFIVSIFSFLFGVKLLGF